MVYPENLSYAKSHEWIEVSTDGSVSIGITEFAADSLGGIVFINLPEVGDSVTALESFADIESVKAVSDILSPVTGKIIEVNEPLKDSPELINSDPYSAWFIRVDKITEREDLMDSDAYAEFCESDGH